jgi:hypothetical protein
MVAGICAGSGRVRSNQTTPTVPAGSDVVGVFGLIKSEVAAVSASPVRVATVAPVSPSTTATAVSCTGTAAALVTTNS